MTLPENLPVDPDPVETARYALRAAELDARVPRARPTRATALRPMIYRGYAAPARATARDRERVRAAREHLAKVELSR